MYDMTAPIVESANGEYYPAENRDWTAGEIEQAVRAVDPTVFFVPPRVLRRVIKQHNHLTGFALRVPHRKSYAIDSAALLEIVDRGELSPKDGSDLPGRVILLSSPEPRTIDAVAAGILLAHYWRLLFHIRVHTAVEAAAHGAWETGCRLGAVSRRANGCIAETTERSISAPADRTSSLARRRIEQIGPAGFEEIRLVLAQENFLLPPAGDWSCYVEFAALYLELRYFSPSFLPRYFPSLDDAKAVEAVLGQDVEADCLFQATRPSGAIYLADRCEIDHVADSASEPDRSPGPSSVVRVERLPTKCRALMQRARRPASLGNIVRAAIYRARAEQCAPTEMADQVQKALKMDLYRLVRRLQAALESEASDPQPWQDLFLVLARQTAAGFRTPESRLLYDLQKVCVDHEREIYTVDVVEWAISLGRRPIKRPLTHQRDVLMLRHLRSALGRLAVVRLTESQRERLAALIRRATERVEARLRDRLRPFLSSAFDQVGLTPRNTPEVVARKKLIEELLDYIVDHGFFTMGLLRDAISRNQLKLPDLAQAGDFLYGDQLLRADRRLAIALDGVYHAGEFYLRGMQRLSSLAFGTAVGRFVTRFAAVPFGGAYVALAGLHHLAELVGGLPAAPNHVPLEPEIGAGSGPAGWLSAQVSFPAVVVVLGLFLMGLINSVRFRAAVAFLFRVTFQVLRHVLVEPVRWMIRWQWLQRLLHSRLYRLSVRFVIKPLLWTAILSWSLPQVHFNWRTSAGKAAVIFLIVNLLLNSRLGRTLEEVVADWLVQTWHRFGLRIITGLFWLVVDLFKRILEALEWLLYTVDEWLRFHSGQSAAVLGMKGLLGAMWFFVAYVLRFSVNVLIEPQFNPIKHFPVVTVSHKLLWPLWPSLASLLERTMSKAWANALAPAVLTCIPGVFGFLVWELKENWRLYAANRRRQLGPAAIGSHGETMVRLLKPGFHSGTLPKRFAKLRRAERKARKGGSWRAARKHLQAVRHLEAAIGRYVDRDLNQLLRESRAWQGPSVTLEPLRVGATAVKLRLAAAGTGRKLLHVVIAIQAGWLVADVLQAGWAGCLPPPERDLLTTALAGLYKSAGVELVRQQLLAAIPPQVPAFAVTHRGLAIWADDELAPRACYDLRNGEQVIPQAPGGFPDPQLPALARRSLVFAEQEMTWDQWVEIWRQDSTGQARQPSIPIPVQLLPEPGRTSGVP